MGERPLSLEASVRAVLGDLALDVELHLRGGETVALVGPNAAGKTTLLRALAGLVPLTGGRVVLDGRTLEDVAEGVYVPPNRRPIGVVFQDYLLFPHLDAEENVAFGLRARGVARTEAHRRAADWLVRLGLGDQRGARPAQLSGGQAQRVALARALATRPALLLLDEPLSALDSASRAEVRRHLQHHLASFDGVRLLITHDPLEAMALARRLVVLEHGRVTQAGTAEEITRRPRTDYVAQLVGTNLYRGRASGGRVVVEGGHPLTVPDAPPGDVLAAIHPRAVALHPDAPAGTPRNVWRARVVDLEPLGDRVRVRVAGPVPIVSEVTSAAVRELSLEPGREVWVSVKATEIAAYPA